MDIRRRGLTKTYEAEKPLSTTSHEILHTQLVLQRKIAMEDIYTSVETIYILKGRIHLESYGQLIRKFP